MRTLALAAAVLGLLVPAAPATAATWSHTDADHDVWLWGRGAPEAAPGNATADVTRVVVRHRSDAVVLRSTVRRLSRSGWGLSWTIAAEGSAKRYTVLLLRYDGERSFRLVRGLDERGESTPVRCGGLDWSADRDAGRVSVTVPRGCLGDPAWVRAGVLVGADNGDDADEMSFYDVGTVDGYTSYIRPVVGPRVRRG